MIVSLTKMDGTVLTYPVARVHTDDASNRLMLALAEPRVFDKPEKTVYTVAVRETAEGDAILTRMALFESYNIVIDNSVEIDGSKPLAFVQNMFTFINI